MADSAKEVEARVAGVVARVQETYSRWHRDTSVEQMRADWDTLFWNDSQPCEYWDANIGGVGVRWIVAPGVNKERVLLYFHGGGYKMGSVVSHHDLMVRLSASADCQVLGVDYRLGPEFGFPAPIDDGLTVYRALLSKGFSADCLALAGDSAGGGIAASMLLVLRSEQLPQPSAAVLLSAWLDMTLAGESYESRAKFDPVHQKFMLQAIAKQYLGAAGNAQSPLASPLFADLTGLPPLLLQTGDCEVGLDDSLQFAAKAKAAGNEVELSVWEQMIHVFQQFPDELPEARAAIKQIGDFLKMYWGSPR